MTVDEIFVEMKNRHGAEVQAALDWQAQDGGEVVFTVGIDRRAKAQLDAEAIEAKKRPEALLAEVEALKAKVAELEATKEPK